MASDPALTIWVSPRATIREIVATRPDLHVVVLTCIAGVVQTLDRASNRNLGDKLSLPAILVVAFTLGPLGQLLAWWIWSILIAWTGTFFRGKGNDLHIRAALAWAAVPTVLSLPLWLVMIGVGGQEMFTDETPELESQVGRLLIVGGLAIVQLALGIWSLVIACNTVAEVQGFRSAWMGLLNLLLGALAGILPIVGLILLGVALLKAG